MKHAQEFAGVLEPNGLVVLDIDNTLLHAVPFDEKAVSLAEYAAEQQGIKRIPIFEDLSIVFRPWIRHFFMELYKNGYEVAIWSAGSQAYVNMASEVLAIKHTFGHVGVFYQGSFYRR